MCVNEDHGKPTTPLPTPILSDYSFYKALSYAGAVVLTPQVCWRAGEFGQ